MQNLYENQIAININSFTNNKIIRLLTNITQVINESISTNNSQTQVNITNDSSIIIPDEEINNEANMSGEILLMMFLLSISLSCGHYIRKYKIKFLNESLVTTMFGLIAGLILHLISNTKYLNNITSAYEKFFMILILPAIIFER